MASTAHTLPMFVPPASKYGKHIIGPITTLFRQFCFLVVNLVLKYPLLGFLILSNKLGMPVFQYMFVVYPGGADDLTAYCPQKLCWLFQGKPAFGGVIRHPSQGSVRGIVLVIPDKPSVFTKEYLRSLQRKLFSFQTRIGVSWIALSGELPGRMTRERIMLRGPFVVGHHGAVYAVVKTVEKAKSFGLSEWSRIAVVGLGYIGRRVRKELEIVGYQTLGIDINPRPRCASSEALLLSQLIVLTTPQGEDIRRYVDKGYIRPGTVVVDDTHPEIPQSLAEDGRLSIFPVELSLEGVRFFPKLPGINGLPGCVVEAIVRSSCGCSFSDFSAFYKAAEKLGFTAVPP